MLLALLWALVASASNLPLVSLEYTADVTGPLVELGIRQTFKNTSSEFIEEVYVFPLQHEAAVDGMWIHIGDREIRAEIHEKREARVIYEEAKAEGRLAALTEQDRPNIFTQRVANIPPGETVEVELRVIQPLARRDSAWELVFPLTVAPRFTPPGSDYEEALHAPIAMPGSRASGGVEVGIDVAIIAGTDILDVETPSHPVDFEVDGDALAFVLDGISPTRDFIVRWWTTDDEPVASFLVTGDHGLLTFEPPVAPPLEERVPKDVFWVIDTSGSMSGQPLEVAKGAMRRGLLGMHEADGFAVLGFSNSVASFSEGPLPATAENLAQAVNWVDNMRGGGGTYLMRAVAEAIEQPGDPTRRRIVCFVTDGHISNEDEVLRRIARSERDVTMITVGVGSAPNRHLLDEIAKAADGTASYVSLNEDPERAIDMILDRIERPVLRNIEIDWGGWAAYEQWPERIPNLMADKPVRVALRLDGSGPIHVSGEIGNQVWERQIQPRFVEHHRSIETLFARDKVGWIHREYLAGRVFDERNAILQTALEYEIVSDYTSFVAVDDEVLNPEGSNRKVRQPSELPDGMDPASVPRNQYAVHGAGEVIEVVATRDAIDVNSTSQGTVLTQDFLQRIPAGRSYQSAVSLAPGVVGGGNPSAGGGAYNENTYMLDGANVTDPVTGTFSVNFNFDAIEQIEVLLGGYMPEYGTSLGGIINIVTQSGTNNLEFDTSVFASGAAGRSRMDERWSADGLLLAPSGFDSTFSAVSVASKISGPLIRDRAWFLISYQRERSVIANTGVPQTRDYDGHYIMSKLTLQPTAEHRVTSMVQLDPTTIDNIDQGDPYQKGESQGRQVQGGTLGNVRWQWFLSPDVNLDSQVLLQKTFIEVSGVPCTHANEGNSNRCEAGEDQGAVDWETPGRLGIMGAYDAVNFSQFYFDDRYRYHGSTALSLVSLRDPLRGKHDIKIGLQGDTTVWDQVQGFNGNQYYVDLNVVPYDPTTLTNYYWVETSGPLKFRTTGSQFSAFVQDSYEPVSRLTLNYGLRYDRYSMRNDLGVPVLTGSIFGPRMFGAWDPFGDAKTKIATGWGRFGDTGQLGTAAFTSASAYGSKLMVGELFYDPETGAGLLGGAAGAYSYDPAVNDATVHDKLGTPRVDELLLTIEREIAEDVAVSSKWHGKLVRNQYEYDDTNLLYDSDGSAVIGSRNGDSLQNLYRQRTPVLSKRDYLQWDLGIEKVPSHRWAASATYTYTRSVGSSTSANSGSFANDPQSAYSYGPLNTDLRHMVKSNGFWDLPTDPWKQTIGFALEYYAGQPYERLYWSESNASGFGSQDLRIRQRGTYLRGNANWVFSVKLQQEIDVRKGKIIVDLEVQNLFDNRAPDAYSSALYTDNRLQVVSRQDPRRLQAGLRYRF